MLGGNNALYEFNEINAFYEFNAIYALQSRAVVVVIEKAEG
jgi:hypothetical protein